MKTHISLLVMLTWFIPVLAFAQGKTNLPGQIKRVTTGAPTQIERRVVQTVVDQAEKQTGSNLPAIPPYQEPPAVVIPGVGTVRKYTLGPDMDITTDDNSRYTLQNPTRRQHMEHYTPTDLMGIIRRHVIHHNFQSTATQWENQQGLKHYTDQRNLALDLNAFYKGEGIRVMDLISKTEALIYALPVEGIVYEPSGREARTLVPREDIVVFFPDRNTGQLIKLAPEALRFFTLVVDDAPLE
ncbi:MAG: hypothetical protein IKP96_01015 [Elusimicrobiaceae bacterium]|nr:hypothetical protein [Elusimicrobiaceae bacterium]